MNVLNPNLPMRKNQPRERGTYLSLLNVILAMNASKLILLLSILAALFLAGCISEKTISDTLKGDDSAISNTGKFVAGATCEMDEDCVYALNAYPIQKCISANCPPPEDEQPAPNDPKYEWKESYLDECVNNAQLNGTNVQGEPLQIDTRSASCACEAVNLPGTSIDGQKICRKKFTESVPEDSGI
jgi:hypothetical protein